MKRVYTKLLLPICVASLFLQLAVPCARAQEQAQGGQPTPLQQEETEDVVRITTELVQTDVSVFDRQGRFVDGLKKEDFELRVDGKPVAVNFFERVAAGTVDEEAQLAAARGMAAQAGGKEGASVKPLDRGRVVVFFLDDMHMAFDSLKRAKDTVSRYIDKEMGQNDLLAIASPSGQIGFLQQFTDNKEVLRAALKRLNFKNFDPRDMQPPVMTPYQALLINRGDSDITSYFVEETLRQNPGITGDMALSIVGSRASNILQQMARTSTITLSTLESLVRSSAQLPGRKVVFFISDGFFLDTRNSDTTDRIRRITDASARSGVVVYSLDAKGLVHLGMPDASSNAAFDPAGRLQRAAGGELAATQDVMNAIAVDTGGRLVHNTNVLDKGLTKALDETSLYYLLAWRPEVERGGSKKFHRIEVRVKNRPELSVRVQRGYFDARPQQKPKESSAKAKTPADPLRKAIGALFPLTGLPTQLAVSYMDVPTGGLTLVASMKIEGENIKFEQKGGKPTAVIDVAGAIINAQGKQLDGFRERLTAAPNEASATELRLPDINYNFRTLLKPGLYQVRVAARDEASGQTGSATQWIEIPDLSKRQLSLSSLIVGERKPGAAEQKGDTSPVESVPFSIDHRFERSSHLRFLVYIYNAARGTSGGAQPDVALQVQIFRDDQPVVTTPLRKLETEAQDPARLPYAAEISLQTMRAGHYILKVTAIDRIAKTSASQHMKFEVQ
jgi:VWFA-related protein